MVIEDTEQCTRKALVALLGISVSHFHTLKQAGVFNAVANGRYNLKAAIAAWAQYHADGFIVVPGIVAPITLTGMKRLTSVSPRSSNASV